MVINICIEKKYPFSTAIYIIDPEAINAGEQLYKRVLLDMKSCIKDNKYPGMAPQMVGLPKWAL
jgi:hypothetical protein